MRAYDIAEIKLCF